MSNLRIKASPGAPHKKKLQNANWKEEFAIESYGLKIGIRFDQSGWISKIKDNLPPFSKIIEVREVDFVFSVFIPKGPDNHTWIYRNDDFVQRFRSGNEEDLVEGLKGSLEYIFRLVIAQNASDPGIFLHAGVIEWKGKAVIIPGDSNSGKTTLTYELIKAGATYFSDEYAVINMKGEVYPYPKYLAIRDYDGILSESIEASDINARVAADFKPAPVKLVILTKYSQGAAIDNIESLFTKNTQAEFIMKLLPHAFPMRNNPELTLKCLQVLTKKATILSGLRGEAIDFAKIILEYLDNYEFSVRTY